MRLLKRLFQRSPPPPPSRTLEVLLLDLVLDKLNPSFYYFASASNNIFQSFRRTISSLSHVTLTSASHLHIFAPDLKSCSSLTFKCSLRHTELIKCSQFSNLQKLIFAESTPLTCDPFVFLSNLDILSLDVSMCPLLDDMFFKTIACFKNLKELNISNLTLVTPFGLTSFCKCSTKIQTFKASRCSAISLDSIEFFTQYWKSLKVLDISDNIELTNEVVHLIATSCVPLEYFYLTHCHLIDGCYFDLFANIVCLKELNISGMEEIDEKPLTKLLINSELRKLNVSSCLLLSDNFLGTVEYPFLQYLDLSFCPDLTDDFLKNSCVLFPNLLSFIANGSKFSSDAFEYLCINCLKLEQLSLLDCPFVDDFIFIHLSNNLSQSLKSLAVSSEYISDQGIYTLIEKCKFISRLALPCCTGLTPITLTVLLQLKSVLKYLKLSGCGVFSREQLIDFYKLSGIKELEV
ncbi:hypothetical protein RCL1_001393 [Eukaryota sp. TZLM3-RCL]